MPKYLYQCHHCEGKFEIKHSIGKMPETCELCKESGSLNRIPSIAFLSKNNDGFGKKNKAGSVVKEAIKDIKEELSQERERLSSRVYKQND